MLRSVYQAAGLSLPDDFDLASLGEQVSAMLGESSPVALVTRQTDCIAKATEASVKKLSMLADQKPVIVEQINLAAKLEKSEQFVARAEWVTDEVVTPTLISHRLKELLTSFNGLSSVTPKELRRNLVPRDEQRPVPPRDERRPLVPRDERRQLVPRDQCGQLVKQATKKSVARFA